jgi:hypothetical protein
VREGGEWNTPANLINLSIGTCPAIWHCGVKALESRLVEKGLVDPAALDTTVETYERKIGPRNGARFVARAWGRPKYKKRLVADATASIPSSNMAPTSLWTPIMGVTTTATARRPRALSRAFLSGRR